MSPSTSTSRPSGSRGSSASCTRSARRSWPSWPRSRRSSCWLPKLKLLTTAGTMLVSIVAYATICGASRSPSGFVILLLVHEMGHVIALRREGIKAQRADVHPVPRRGDQRPLAGRQRGRRGPGRASPARCWARSARRSASSIWHATGDDFWRALALHRLLPEPVQPAAGRAARRRPRDGGDGARGCGSSASWAWSCSPSCSPTRSS